MDIGDRCNMMGYAGRLTVLFRNQVLKQEYAIAWQYYYESDGMVVYCGREVIALSVAAGGRLLFRHLEPGSMVGLGLVWDFDLSVRLKPNLSIQTINQSWKRAVSSTTQYSTGP